MLIRTIDRDRKRPITNAEKRTLSKTLEHMRESSGDGLVFRPLYMTTARLVLIKEASFANAINYKSQLGNAVLMIDDTGTRNIIHYPLNRFKWVTSSLTSSEVHVLVAGRRSPSFHFVIRRLTEEFLNKKETPDAYVDSSTLFDVIAKDSRSSECRLQIDIHALCQYYAASELKQLGWIPGHLNPADCLTKVTKPAINELLGLMHEG